MENACLSLKYSSTEEMAHDTRNQSDRHKTHVVGWSPWSRQHSTPWSPACASVSPLWLHAGHSVVRPLYDSQGEKGRCESCCCRPTKKHADRSTQVLYSDIYIQDHPGETSGEAIHKPTTPRFRMPHVPVNCFSDGKTFFIASSRAVPESAHNDKVHGQLSIQ